MAWFDDLELPGSTITGHFAFVHEDGPDEDDYPDVRLASGTVRFEATAKAVKAGGAWIGIAPVEARIFDGEIIVDEDDPNPPRILSTDADVGVEDWGWKAIFDIAGANIKPVTFKAPKEGVHLTSGDLIPVTGHPVEVIAGPPGTSVVGIRDNGDQTVTWLYSDGTESDPYEIGTGPRGVSGIASVTSPESGVWMIDQATDGDEDRLKDLQEAVYDKVARSEFEDLEAAVDTKLGDDDLVPLNTAIQSKADTSALSALSTQVAAIPKVRTGIVTITPTEGNSTSSAVVTFPTPFDSVPNVVATAWSGLPENVTQVTVSNVTATGCTVYMYRTTRAPTNVMWMALSE